MFRYFQARISTMLFTTSALLRRTRRKVFQELRQEQGAVVEATASLTKDEQLGDVDKLFADVLRFSKKYVNEEDDITVFERNAVIAEARALDSLEKPEIFLDRLWRVANKLPDPMKQGIVPKLKAIEEDMTKLNQLEQANLKLQYTIINRQEADMKGFLQNFVWSENDIRTLADNLWNERAEIRGAKSEDKSVVKIEDDLFTLLDLAEHGKLVAGQEQRLGRALDDLKDHSRRLYESYARVIEDFTKVLKVFVLVEFRFEKDWQKVFDTLQQHLVASSFPQEGEKSLVAVGEIERKGKEKILHHKKNIDDVMRRTGRLETRKAA